MKRRALFASALAVVLGSIWPKRVSAYLGDQASDDFRRGYDLGVAAGRFEAKVDYARGFEAGKEAESKRDQWYFFPAGRSGARFGAKLGVGKSLMK